MDAHCKQCGLAHNRRSPYCSKECYVIARNARRKEARHQANNLLPVSPVSKKCEICGDDLDINPQWPHKKYCSDKCKKAAQRARRKAGIASAYSPPTSKQEIICETCGASFIGEPTAKYCSNDCRTKGYRTIKECPKCGKEHDCPKSMYGKYCSQECQESNTPVLTCNYCGKEYERGNSYNGSGCCSRRCALADGRKYYRDNFESAAQPIECVCEICGRKFVSKTAAGAKYCGARCADKAYRIRNPGRRGAHVQRAKRYGVKYKYFNLLKVLERDNWTCYICGKPTPKELRGTYEPNAPELDHVVPLSRGGSHTRDNVRCSCRECNINKSDKLLDTPQGGS